MARRRLPNRLSRPSVPVAGPAIWISFAIAGFAALLSAVSYAEMAGLVPASGSSYSYTYATRNSTWAEPE